MTALEARFGVRRGGFRAEAELRVDAGEVLALIGPNGAGKSTLLAAIAGLVPIASGEVRLGGRMLEHAGAGPRLRMPPEHRRIGLLQQDARLFPHLSALENVAFGPRAGGARPRAARAAAAEWLARVGLDGAAAKRPGELSGGQRQRVAIARALAAAPELLLLDEPFASLDVDAAAGVRAVLAEVLAAAGTPAILVSHDVLDAIVLAGRIAVVDAGSVVESGTTHDVLTAPRTAFAASIAGLVLVPGRVAGGVLETAGGERFAGADAADFSGAGVALFRPGRVRVDAGAPADAASAPNRWAANIASLRPAVGGVRLGLVSDGGTRVEADVDAAAAEALRPAPGIRVVCALDPDAVALHPAP